MISYATIPDGFPVESVGRNGLYTEHLLKQMDDPNQHIMQMLKRVMGGVKTASQGKQIPWVEVSIEGISVSTPVVVWALPRLNMSI